VADQPDAEILDSAVIDDAHLGDIHGAFGSLRWRQLWPARTLRRRLLVLATVMGPGVLALIADNDAGGVATYAAGGRYRGTGLLWVLIPLGVVLFLNQEMAARLGVVSGVGHARLIFERFGKLWGAFSLGDLLLLNVLTLVTEFIGVRIAAAHVGIPPAVAVGAAAAVLVAATLLGGFRRWERTMYVLVVVNVLLVPLLLLIPHSGGHAPVPAGAPPPWAGGTVRSGVLLIVALMGTTVAPWQLFFQQSAVVDKRITPRWMAYARFDTLVGTLLMLAGAAAVMVVSAAAFSGGRGGHGGLPEVLATVSSRLGTGVGDVLALLLFDGAVLGAAALSMATSYAIGDVTGARHSLHRSPREAPLFYAVTTMVVVATAGVVLLPGMPLGRTTAVVQVLAGLLLPSATVFLLLLCNDTAVMGPWSNGVWLNALTATSVAGLLGLSAMLVVTGLFPGAPAVTAAVLVGGLLAGGLLVVGVAALLRRRRVRRLRTDSAATPDLALVSSSAVVMMGPRGRGPAPPVHARAFWRTPPLDELRRPVWSVGRRTGMVALRVYVLLCVALFAGRIVAKALGH
jgi:Mn2+/Fe2+ NRAMP family transporter